MLLKPLFDRTVALVGLLLLWPVLLVIAVLVRGMEYAGERI